MRSVAAQKAVIQRWASMVAWAVHCYRISGSPISKDLLHRDFADAGLISNRYLANGVKASKSRPLVVLYPIVCLVHPCKGAGFRQRSRQGGPSGAGHQHDRREGAAGHLDCKDQRSQVLAAGGARDEELGCVRHLCRLHGRIEGIPGGHRYRVPKDRRAVFAHTSCSKHRVERLMWKIISWLTCLSRPTIRLANHP